MIIESLSQIKSAEIYLIHNGINPDALRPADIAEIQDELNINPCEITFTRLEDTKGEPTITKEGESLVEEFFAKFSMTPDEAPSVIRTMAEDIAKKALSNSRRAYENGYANSTELIQEAEVEL